jgi:hypothetical protein
MKNVRSKPSDPPGESRASTRIRTMSWRWCARQGEELAAGEPECFKAFVLAVMAGLRRNEIDKLEWARFNWSAD